MNIIDSPGLGDPNQLRTDEDTFNNICDTVFEKAFKVKDGGKPYGLSGCI